VNEAAAPAQAQPQARHTHPRGFIVRALQSVLRGGLPAAAALIGTGALGLVMMMAAVAAVAAISFAIAWLKWSRLTYTTGPEDIRVEQGLLSLSARSVPYERIQDVSIEQKWLARLFGLAEVKFETGAGGKEEISLAFLSLPEAERLRELVRERKEGGALTAPPGTEVQPQPAPAEVLFALTNRRLVLFGLFEFSLVVFAVLLGAADQLDFLLPDDLGVTRWKGWFEGGKSQLEGIDRTTQVLGLAGAVLIVVLAGVLTGVVRTGARDYGFLLERTAKGFRRRRGLFSKSDVLLPVHRVQAALIKSRLIRKWFGWHGLEFVSLAQDGAKTPHHAAAPFARLGEIWPIVRAAGFEPPAEETRWDRPSPRPWLYRTLFIGVLFAALAIGAGVTVQSRIPFVAGGLAVLGTVLLNYLGWRRHRHAVSRKQIFVRSGSLAPRLMIAAQVKLQSVEIVQGPLARWGGYATLHLGLAGGKLDMHGIPIAEAQAIRREVLGRIDAVDFSRLNAA